MRRIFPLCVVVCAAVVLLAGIGAALTAETPSTPTGAPATTTPAHDATGGSRWVETFGGGGTRS